MTFEAIAQDYLDTARHSLRNYKNLAERALDQVNDDEYLITLDEESNSLAIIMKHMAGNMFSRWTDFLTTDGEKPNRNRDYEFIISPDLTAEEIRDYWERGWRCVFNAVDQLRIEDLGKTVYVNGKPFTVVQALNLQLMHYAQHIGQIIFLAKHFRATDWQSLSVPRNRAIRV